MGIRRRRIMRGSLSGNWNFKAVSYMAITFSGGTLACTLWTEVNT